MLFIAIWQYIYIYIYIYICFKDFYLVNMKKNGKKLQGVGIFLCFLLLRHMK